MIDSIIFLLATSLLIMVIGIAWVVLRRYSLRLSQMDEHLRAITVMLSEMPKETSLQEYMFSQHQVLRSIEEKLDTDRDSALSHQYIQKHTKLLRTIISMLEEDRNEVLTRSDLEKSLRVANDSLEKVLWSMRFDEDKYAESIAMTGGSLPESVKANIKSINKYNESDHETLDDAEAMKNILKSTEDSYGAVLKYMQQTGKSGSNALQTLDMVGGLHSG